MKALAISAKSNVMQLLCTLQGISFSLDNICWVWWHCTEA